MFWAWKQTPSLNPVAPDQVAGLQGTALSDEKTRSEIEKLRLDILEERSWRTKLFLSLILPIGGALAFVNTFVQDHATARLQRDEQNYTQAAQQLSSNEPAVRLNAVLVLASFITDRGWLEDLFQEEPTEQDCGKFESLRGRQSLALLIGHLAGESDPSVLDQIAQVAGKHPCLTLNPVLSLDRSAAVQFARAAGDFTALYTMLQIKKPSLGGDDPVSVGQDALGVLTAVTARTGSPFQAKDMLNVTFVSNRMLELPKCPFREIYDKQFQLSTSAGLPTPLRGAPPTSAELQKSMQAMLESAAWLEKASYVLTQLANNKDGFALLRQHARTDSLYGVAIVVGEFQDDRVRTLQAAGAYVQTYLAPNTCPLPQKKPH